jgi:ABC-type multidrug transport system ATPase subunit
VGYVDQYDDHIPSLTVNETLEFASICQWGFAPKYRPLADAYKKVREGEGPPPIGF